MAFDSKITVKLHGTLAQYKTLIDDLGGSSATGPSRVVVREVRKQVQQSLRETREQRLAERPSLASYATSLTELDQQVSDIDAEYGDFDD